MKKQLLSLTLALLLCLSLLPATALAAAPISTPAATDNAVTLYADYGDGFEFLAPLYFEDGVTEQFVTVDRPITALRVVKGVCYELNLDRLTLNGVCPAGYERKLSATDNDLIEVEDSMDFALSGSGELVIAARAPVKVMGENCSFKFPQINRGPIVPRSYFYSYTLGSNPGSFSDGDALIVPDKADLFDSTMCYPDSGHPDAPTDIYVADDGQILYVFFEAFMDNTFDHGKDFAAVHVKSGDAVKTYKVHTTEENEYGRWWFDYTDSSEEYDWEHMCYVVEVPLAELMTADGALSLAFEYYGTAGYQGAGLAMLAIDGVFLVADGQPEGYWNNPHEYYPEADLLPAPGKTINSAGGSTPTGDWWLTNNGGEFTLTLNGATLDEMSEATPQYSSYVNQFAPLYTLGNLTIELAEGTINTIACDNADNYYGIEAQCQELVIQGAGILNVSEDNRPVYVNNLLTIKDGAQVNATLTGTHTNSSWGSSYTYNAVDVYGLTVGGAALAATADVTVSADSGDSVYVSGIEIGSTEHRLAVANNATVEAFASGGNTGNYAISWWSDSVRLDLDADIATILEGDNAESAAEAEEVTTEYVYYYTRSKPYVKLVTKNKATLQEMLDGADGFVYTASTPGSNAYTYAGEREITVASDGASGTVSYLIPAATLEEDPTVLMNDLARFLGALYRYDDGASVASVTYGGDEYTWDAESTLKGSRWTCTYNAIDGPMKVSLVSAITAAYNSADEPLTSIVLKINDYDVTFEVVATYPVSFLPGDGTGKMEPVMAPAGEYTLPACTFTAPDGKVFDKWQDAAGATYAAGAKVEITGEAEFTATWKDKPVGGGGGGPVTYPIEAPVAENGTVTVSPIAASKGTTVTVTPTPDEGYEVDKVTVTDKDGNEILITDNGDGTYSFTMPGGKVTVNATFKEIDHSAVCSSRAFTDVDPEAWYHEAVDYVVENGLMVGTADDQFNPNGTTTRAMIVTILYRLEGKPAVSGETPFDDVAADEWYTDAVNWASENDIVSGYGGGKFGPTDNITREQFATILYRYAQYKGYNVSVGEDTNVLSYNDALDVSDWAMPAIQWACGTGPMQGDNQGNLLPGDSATRAQAAALIMRFIENVK